MRPTNLNGTGMVVGTGSKGVQVSADVAHLLELRMQGMNLKEAAEVVGITYSQAQGWIRKYIRHVSSGAVKAFRDQELKTMEHAQARILEIAQMTHYQFYQGKQVFDDDGEPVLDTDPNIRAEIALLKLLERKSRLVGGDRYVAKSEDIDPAKQNDENATPGVLTPAMLEAAIQKLEGKIGIGLRHGATDVEVRPVDPLVAEAGNA